jgi:hypothetical protein
LRLLLKGLFQQLGGSLWLVLTEQNPRLVDQVLELVGL